MRKIAFTIHVANRCNEKKDLNVERYDLNFRQVIFEVNKVKCEFRQEKSNRER